MQQTGTSPSARLNTFAAAAGATIVAFIALTLLAGLPPADNMGMFVIGVIILIGVTAAIGALGWHLLIRPLPAGLTPAPALTIRAPTRSLIALLLTLGAIGFSVGATWDEIWHTLYGVPFGEDLLWRPHLLMYFCFLTMTGIGAWSWWVMMQRGRGTLQQRFRSNPLLGFSFLSGLYTVFAIGADPIWHALYGEDITPWSLPHLLLLVMVLVMGLLATAYHYTLLPAQPDWRPFWQRLSWRHMLMILVLACTTIEFVVLFTVQWYYGAGADPAVLAAAAGGASPQELRALSQTVGQTVGRGVNMSMLMQVVVFPDWLLTVFLAFIAGLFGTLALHTTRILGAATLTGLVAFGVRWALNSLFGSAGDGTLTILLIAPLLLALDLTYAVSTRREQRAPALWVTTLVVGGVLALINLPMTAAFFPFMPTDLGVLPARALAGLLTIGATLWFARMMSDLSGDPTHTPAQSAAETAPRWATALTYGGFFAFVVWFVVTAPPPV
jgi:hypothetical protein